VPRNNPKHEVKLLCVRPYPVPSAVDGCVTTHTGLDGNPAARQGIVTCHWHVVRDPLRPDMTGGKRARVVKLFLISS
jgi:hypothetical protein